MSEELDATKVTWDGAVEAALRPLLDAWLADLDLRQAFYSPLGAPGGEAFAEAFAHRAGLDLGDDEEVGRVFRERVAAYLTAEDLELGDQQQVALAGRLRDELLGLSILEPLLRDPKVYELMVNGPGQVYMGYSGRLVLYAHTFDDSDHVLRVIHRLLLPLGVQVDQRSPRADVRLPDGALLNVVLPPLALNGPCLTLRRFAPHRLQIDDLIRFGSLTAEMGELLEAAIRARLNIVIAGGTGSGKYTLLNLLSAYIPPDERVVSVEGIATLQIQHSHVVSLQSRLPDAHGEGGFSVVELLGVAAQMRPERLIIGELQGPEAFEALRLASRGHDGSLMLLYAHTSPQALDQLELMIKLEKPSFPEQYLRAFIAQAVDLVVQQTRLRDGQRKVTQITEVLAATADGYALRDLFAFRETGVNERGRISGEFVCEHRPSPGLLDRLRAFGPLPPFLA